MFCSAMCLLSSVIQSPFPSFPSLQRDQWEGLLSKKDKTMKESGGQCQTSLKMRRIKKTQKCTSLSFSVWLDSKKLSVADPDPEGSKIFGRIRSRPEINVMDPDSKVVYTIIHISHLQVVVRSVVELRHFGRDPDPGIHASDQWMRIRLCIQILLFLSWTFKKPTKNYFF